MSPLAKVFVVINLVLAICFTGMVASLFTARKHWKQEHTQFVAKVEENAKAAKEDAERFEGAIAANESNINSLEDELRSKTTEATTLQNENSDLANAKNRLQSDLDGANQRLDQRDAWLQERDNSIASLTAAKDNAVEAEAAAIADSMKNKSRFLRVSNDNANLATSLADANTLNNSITKDRDDLASVVQRARELNPGLIDSILVGPPPPAIDGQIVAVRPEENIVVISVGGDDKVESGFEFTVYRQDKFLGKIKITKVTADLAGAKVLYLDSTGQSIQVGDRVSTRMSY